MKVKAWAVVDKPKREIPREIYIQFWGDDDRDLDNVPEFGEDVTWCHDRINDSDIRYVIDRRQVKAKKGGRK